MEKIKARVLVDGHFGKVNDVVELEKEVAEAAEKSGAVDTSKAAVEYALSLTRESEEEGGAQ